MLYDTNKLYITMNKLTRYLAGASACFSAFLLPLAAQEVSDEDVIILDEVTADDVPIEESILATTRPITSVYGTDRSVLDTPRNVNIISREQLDAISIKDVRDFSKLTSSSYTKTNFGAPTTPNLRGQEADLMINGIRRGHSVNGNGVPINFNSVESVNIVKGPAGAVFGTSNYVGGYADLITKRAYFESGGSAEYSWGSFGQHTVNLDVNIPISETVATRFSFQGKDWKGYWDRWYDESQSLYGTVVWAPNETYRLDVMAEYYKGNYTENWGINRPTQDLFDKGLYIPNRGTDADYAANYAANPPEGFGNFGAIPVDVENPIKADRKWKLSAPGDDSNADVFWAQAIQEVTVSDNFKINNNTYYHFKDRETFSSYHYSELMRDNWSIENRLQFVQDFEFDTIKSLSLNYGLRLKYQEIWAVNHFFNEPANYYDLSRDPQFNAVPEVSFGDQFFNKSVFVDGKGARGVLSRWYVGAQDGNLDGELDPYEVEAKDSESAIISPFFQADLKVNDWFSLLGGYTIDYVNTTEFVPTEVKTVAFPVTDDFYDEFDYDAALFNANISVVFKPTGNTAIYLTYNEGEHFTTDTGGRIAGPSLDDDLTTELTELGFNASFFDDKVYLGAALFRQEYTTRNQDGSVDVVETDGLEVEVNYQPNRNFFATLGFSLLDSERTAGFLASSYTAADVPAGGFYTSPTFPGLVEGQKFETPGVPPVLLNALVQYKFDNGIGLQANAVYTSSMEAGYDGALIDGGDAAGNTVVSSPKLGAQIEFDAKIFYEYENWRFEFAVFNLTDEENWDLPNTGYSNGSAVARPERNYELSVKYEW